MYHFRTIHKKAVNLKKYALKWFPVFSLLTVTSVTIWCQTTRNGFGLETSFNFSFVGLKRLK